MDILDTDWYAQTPVYRQQLRKDGELHFPRLTANQEDRKLEDLQSSNMASATCCSARTFHQAMGRTKEDKGLEMSQGRDRWGTSCRMEREGLSHFTRGDVRNTQRNNSVSKQAEGSHRWLVHAISKNSQGGVQMILEATRRKEFEIYTTKFYRVQFANPLIALATFLALRDRVSFE